MKKLVLACRTLEDEINSLLPADTDCEFLEYALHNTPNILQAQLSTKVKEATSYDTLLLGYGLCSNGVAGLGSKQHTMVVPRVHDCISLLLGSRDRYNLEFAAVPATYYLSRGWIKQKGDPLSSFQKYREKYGEENARYIIGQEYVNYQRVVFIHTVGDNREFVDYSRQVAEFLGVSFVEMEGSLTYFEKMLREEWDTDFIITPPGQLISQVRFM